MVAAPDCLLQQPQGASLLPPRVKTSGMLLVLLTLERPRVCHNFPGTTIMHECDRQTCLMGMMQLWPPTKIRVCMWPHSRNPSCSQQCVISSSERTHCRAKGRRLCFGGLPPRKLCSCLNAAGLHETHARQKGFMCLHGHHQKLLVVAKMHHDCASEP